VEGLAFLERFAEDHVRSLRMASRVARRVITEGDALPDGYRVPPIHASHLVMLPETWEVLAGRGGLGPVSRAAARGRREPRVQVSGAPRETTA
jgi:hypothetical protein